MVLTELLISDALIQDLLDRARRLAMPVDGWHVAVTAHEPPACSGC